MKRFVCIFMIVFLACSVAFAEGIDLLTMSDSDLFSLYDQVEGEMVRRGFLNPDVHELSEDNVAGVWVITHMITNNEYTEADSLTKSVPLTFSNGACSTNAYGVDTTVYNYEIKGNQLLLDGTLYHCTMRDARMVLLDENGNGMVMKKQSDLNIEGKWMVEGSTGEDRELFFAFDADIPGGTFEFKDGKIIESALGLSEIIADYDEKAKTVTARGITYRLEIHDNRIIISSDTGSVTLYRTN